VTLSMRESVAETNPEVGRRRPAPVRPHIKVVGGRQNTRLDGVRLPAAVNGLDWWPLAATLRMLRFKLSTIYKLPWLSKKDCSVRFKAALLAWPPSPPNPPLPEPAKVVRFRFVAICESIVSVSRIHVPAASKDRVCAD